MLFEDFHYNEEEIFSESSVNNLVGTEVVDGRSHEVYFHVYTDVSIYTTDYNPVINDISGGNIYIKMIALWTPRFCTSKGITVGATINELKEVYRSENLELLEEDVPERIRSVMANLDGCMEEADGLFCRISALAGSVLAKARCGALISACEMQGQELREIYGQVIKADEKPVRLYFLKGMMRMKNKKIAFAYICMVLFLIGCTNVAEDSHMATSNGDKMEEISEILEENTDILSQEAEDTVSNEQNDAYKLFYGTWEITSIVSHGPYGTYERCEDILGMQVTYLPDRYEFGGIVTVDNPNYLMSIFPTNTPHLFYSHQEVNVNTLMPDSDYFVWVQIVDKPSSSEIKTGSDYGYESYVGSEFFIKDDNTLYCYDYNCIYEMKRIDYIDDYDPEHTLTAQERW